MDETIGRVVGEDGVQVGKTFNVSMDTLLSIPIRDAWLVDGTRMDGTAR